MSKLRSALEHGLITLLVTAFIVGAIYSTFNH